MNPVVSAKEKPSAARTAPQPHTNSTRPTPPQTQLRVSYYRRMNVQRVYPLTVEVPALRAGQTPPPVVESVVVRPVIPGALVSPAEQRLDPNRPGASAKFHVTPLATGWLPDSRVEVYHPGRPVQEILLGSRPMSWVLWIILLVLFFPIIAPLRLLLGPWGGPPRAVTQRATWLMLFLTILLPVLLLTFTRYARMSGTITTTIINPNGVMLEPAPVGPGGGPMRPMPPMPNLGAGDPGKGADDQKEEPRKEEKDEPKEKKEEPKPPAGKPMEEGGKGGEVQLPAADKRSPVVQVVRDYSDQPGALLQDRLETLFKEQVPSFLQPPTPEDRDTPTVSSVLGTTYGVLCDRFNQNEFHPSFWAFVVLLLFTGLTWVTHTGYRAATRKAIDLAPRVTDAEAIETLPLGPNDRMPNLPS